MTAEVRDVIVDALKTELKTKIGDQKNQLYLKMSQDGEYWCPNCRIRVIMHYPHKFCANCGQAFKE